MCTDSSPTELPAPPVKPGVLPQPLGVEWLVREGVFGPSGLMGWLTCCSRRAGVCSGDNAPERKEGGCEAAQPQVLLLASSDVLHALRSPNVNVLLFDVRGGKEFRASHIEGALSVPWQQSWSVEEAGLARLPPELQEHPVLLSMLGKVTPGALGKAFSDNSTFSVTSGAHTPSGPVGSCAIVYDSLGDHRDLVGPAATFANTLAQSGLVPEVGRIAGGFQAFKELNACLYRAEEAEHLAGGHSLEGAWRAPQLQLPGDRPASSRPSSERLSRAATPHGAEQPAVQRASSGEGSLVARSSRGSGGGGGSGQTTPRWKVSISAPTEVAPAEVITGRLFLGNRQHAADLPTLRKLGVTHVINVSRDEGTPFRGQLEYCLCHVSDTVTSNISPAFDKAYTYIQNAFAESADAVVLVHCAGGVSRSTAVVAAYLMRSEHMPLNEVLQYLRERHPAAAPNSGFIHQLMALENRLGIQSAAPPQFADLCAAGYSSSSSSPSAASSGHSAAEPPQLAISVRTPGGDSGGGGGRGRARLSWCDYAAAPTPGAEGVKSPGWGSSGGKGGGWAAVRRESSGQTEAGRHAQGPEAPAGPGGGGKGKEGGMWTSF